MVEVNYLVRHIQPEDREKNRFNVQRALDRGDEEDARVIQEVFAEREREQDSTKTVLVCSVCNHRLLSPTRDGRARRHSRWSIEPEGWYQVWQLMKQIQVLQAELDRLLRALEPPD
jgi:hypothetical protein